MKKKPSGSEKRKRQKRITARFNDAEYAAVKDTADQRGLSPPALVRETLLGIPPPPRVRRPATRDEQAIGRVLNQLGKIGGNLNQLVRYANMGRTLEASLEETLRDLREMRLVVMQALGRERKMRRSQPEDKQP